MNLPAKTSVLIVGAGPAGLILANLLGAEGVATVLIERNPGCVPEPRAVALDGESLRTLQAVGLADRVLENILQGVAADYINGAGTQLFKTDLTARPYGYCLQNSFDQPVLERQLLAGLARFPCVSVAHNTELKQFAQDSESVSAALVSNGNGEHAIQADFMVACDGGRSSIRQNLGIAMAGERLPQKWLVIDTVDTHLGEEPSCRFYCDPRRPAMTIIRPNSERRWEWMLVDDETDEQMLEKEHIDALLAQHTDPAKVEVYRKCVYSFSAVVAERFSAGRVFLAGDAAHMTPPFAGQGLNAGSRDVRNLAWKLSGVVTGKLPLSALDTYDVERREAARAVVDLAVSLGDQIQPTDPEAAAERDAFFAELNTDPAAAASFSADIIAPLSDVRLAHGWFADDGAGGRMLPQPEIEQGTGSVLLDELLGAGFTALVRGVPELPVAVTSHPLWQTLDPSPHYIGDGAHRLPPTALPGFIDGSSGPGITLVRPDRFVLADIGLDENVTSRLDSLQTMLNGAWGSQAQDK